MVILDFPMNIRPLFPTLSLVCFLGIPVVARAQTTEIVSVNSNGTWGNSTSATPVISYTGRYLVVWSRSTNLVPNDTNWKSDTFLHDRLTGMTERVSVNSLGIQGNDECAGASVSSDGRFVAFGSRSSNLVLGDTNGEYDIFVRDRQTGTTRRVNVDSLGRQGNLVSGDPTISADGRYVAFSSWADNLVPGDTNGWSDVFVHDMNTGFTERVSIDSQGLQGLNWSGRPSISANGRFVAFSSSAGNLIAGDTNTSEDVFIHDRQTGMTKRVSVDSQGVEGIFGGVNPAISPDGRYVSFESNSPNLVPQDGNGKWDVFLHDYLTGITSMVSVDSNGIPGNEDSFGSSISVNGEYVSFSTRSDNLVPGDSGNRQDVFVYSAHTGVTERVSVNSFGQEGNRPSSLSTISANGRFVGIGSEASNFVEGPSNQYMDSFVHDRWDGLGANSIFLEGPSSSPVLAPIDFTWQATRGESKYWLLHSQNKNGAILSGHQMDVGRVHLGILSTGVNALNGFGSYTSPPVGAFSVSYTLYFEVLAQDAEGVLYDSNVLPVNFY